MQCNMLLHDLAVPSLANRERILNSKTKDEQDVNHLVFLEPIVGVAVRSMAVVFGR